MGWHPIIVCVVIGAGLLRWLDPPRQRLHPLGFLGLAFWMGLLAAVVAVSAAAVVTRRLYFEGVWALAAAGLAMALARPAWWREYAAMWRIAPRRERLRDVFFWVEWGVIFLALVFFIKNAGFGVAIATHYPFTALDPIGNFALKARLWFETRSLFPAPLLDPEYLMYKRCYPPVIPIGEGLWAAILGTWDDLQIKWLFSACWMAAALLIFAVLRGRGAALPAWIAMTAWIAYPVNITYYWGGAIDGFADTPLAMAYAGAALGLGWAWARPARWREILLIAALLAGPLLIKKEGMALFAILLALLAWRRLPRRHLGAIAGVGAGFYALHWLMTVGVPATHEKDISFSLPLAELWSRVEAFGPLLMEELGKDKKWGNKLWRLIGAVWLFKLLLLPPRRWFGREALLFAAMSAVYTLILLFTINHFHHNFDFAFERLFLHLLPFFLIAAFDGWPATPAFAVRWPRRPAAPPLP